MIGTEFYHGQGLGNQLWAYAVVRSIAASKKFDYCFLGTDLFRGPWLELDMGIKFEKSTARFPKYRTPSGFSSYLAEAKVLSHNGTDISPMDSRLLDVKDGTLIDGTFQSENYFSRPQEVKSWFQNRTPEKRDICVINIRGGEFTGVRDLFIGREYYANAIEHIRSINPAVRFEIVTDDKRLAQKWFPKFPVYSSGGVKRFHGGIYIHPSKSRVAADFFRIQSATYLILANSSFSWWGAYTNPYLEKAIAPKFWARFNTEGPWSNGDSLTKGWDWLDRDGSLWTYYECSRELGIDAGRERDAD